MYLRREPLQGGKIHTPISYTPQLRSDLIMAARQNGFPLCMARLFIFFYTFRPQQCSCNFEDAGTVLQSGLPRFKNAVVLSRLGLCEIVSLATDHIKQFGGIIAAPASSRLSCRLQHEIGKGWRTRWPTSETTGII